MASSFNTLKSVNPGSMMMNLFKLGQDKKQLGKAIGGTIMGFANSKAPAGDRVGGLFKTAASGLSQPYDDGTEETKKRVQGNGGFFGLLGG